MQNLFAEYAHLFKALSDETRLRIYSMLSSEEICACEILEQVNITQPTLSYHMKCCVAAGWSRDVKTAPGCGIQFNENACVSCRHLYSGFKHSRTRTLGTREAIQLTF